MPNPTARITANVYGVAPLVHRNYEPIVTQNSPFVNVKKIVHNLWEMHN